MPTLFTLLPQGSILISASCWEDFSCFWGENSPVLSWPPFSLTHRGEGMTYLIDELRKSNCVCVWFSLSSLWYKPCLQKGCILFCFLYKSDLQFGDLKYLEERDIQQTYLLRVSYLLHVSFYQKRSWHFYLCWSDFFVCPIDPELQKGRLID